MEVIRHTGTVYPDSVRVVFDDGSRVNGMFTRVTRGGSSRSTPCLRIFWPAEQPLPPEAAHLQGTFATLAELYRRVFARIRGRVGAAKQIATAIAEKGTNPDLGVETDRNGGVTGVVLDVTQENTQVSDDLLDTLFSSLVIVPFPYGNPIEFEYETRRTPEAHMALVDWLDGRLLLVLQDYAALVAENLDQIRTGNPPNKSLALLKECERIVGRSMRTKLAAFRPRRLEAGTPAAESILAAAERNRLDLHLGNYLVNYLLFLVNEAYSLFGFIPKKEYENALAYYFQTAKPHVAHDHWLNELQGALALRAKGGDPMDWPYPEPAPRQHWLQQMINFGYALTTALYRCRQGTSAPPRCGFFARHALEPRMHPEVANSLRAHYDKINQNDTLPMTPLYKLQANDDTHTVDMLAIFGIWSESGQTRGNARMVANAHGRELWEVINPYSKQPPSRRAVDSASHFAVREVVRRGALLRVEEMLSALFQNASLDESERRDLAKIARSAEDRKISRRHLARILRRDESDGRQAVTNIVRKVAGRGLVIDGVAYPLISTGNRSLQCQLWHFIRTLGTGQDIFELNEALNRAIKNT